MINLFGEPIEEKSPEDKYDEYINSAAWKRKRLARLEVSGYKCENCGISKFSARLEVHHKSYDNFGHESIEELIVLCPECHADADEQREIERENDRADSALIKGFENWMDNGNTKGWRRLSNDRLSAYWKRFLHYIHSSNIPFWRSPEW